MKDLTKHELIMLPLPMETRSYKPVSHGILLDTIEEKLYKNGMNIAEERFSSNGSGSQMFGVYTIQNGNDEQRLNIGFRNSYDKSLALGMVAGATVIVCSNLMFTGEVKMMRKHTTGALRDFDHLVTRVINNSLQNFDILQEDTRKLKEIPMTTKEMAEIAGRMFINDDIITATQLSIIKKEIHFSKMFKELTKWDFYNHCTEALKISHPAVMMQSHINLHDYVLETA